MVLLHFIVPGRCPRDVQHKNILSSNVILAHVSYDPYSGEKGL